MSVLRLTGDVRYYTRFPCMFTDAAHRTPQITGQKTDFIQLEHRSMSSDFSQL